MRAHLALGMGLVLLAALVTATAAQMAQPEETIIVGGRVVLRVRAPAGGLSVTERAIAIRGRINAALTGESLVAANIFTQRIPEGLAIRVGRIVIVTVTPDDARANATTVEALAQRWTAALRDALPRAQPRPQP